MSSWNLLESLFLQLSSRCYYRITLVRSDEVHGLSQVACGSGGSSVVGRGWRLCVEDGPSHRPLPFQLLTLLLLFCLQSSCRVPHWAWPPFPVSGGARLVVPSPSPETAKAISATWAPAPEGRVRGPQSHAFRPEAPPDTALQCPEQELLRDPDPPVG